MTQHAAHAHGAHSMPESRKPMHEGMYRRLLVMTATSFVAMYALMYAMVDRLGHVYNNVNQVYMAGLMAASMVLIELAVMRSMYMDRRRNAVILGGAVIALAGCWFLIRGQVAVGDKQFLRSMIPHHGGAILMCHEAKLADERIRALCRDITESQQREIDQMTRLLENR
jgi:uncharacterized protein (DUF305 family)